MGKVKKTRKFAQVKRVLGNRDSRLQAKLASRQPSQEDENSVVQHIPQASSALFFQAHQALGPPYHIILDTNFFSHTIRSKIEVLSGLMDLLFAKCIPVVTECSIAELEKLGEKYRLALGLAKDERWQRLTCSHAGTYADDCIVSTVMKHRCYLVGTNDRDLRRRLRKIPGVPLVAVGKGRYTVERLPDIPS
ncbi:rRNA-processing protein fcf1 [Botryosphaeria dothidea]